MTEVLIDWDLLPLEEIPIAKLAFDCHDLQAEHVHVTNPDLVLSHGPIHVQALIDGRYWIHNGRHRTLRALQTGASTITCRVFTWVHLYPKTEH